MSTLTPNEMKTARRRGLALIAAATVVGGLGWAGWQWLHAGNFQSTDNAYVAGHVVQITPQVAGTVVSIGVEDTEFVRAGQVLVQLDAADARIALEQAQAQLAQTVREVRTLFANHGALKAQIRLREADLARAQAEAVRLQDDVNRRAPLLATGAVAQEELQHAKAQLTSAQSAVAAAQSALLTAKEQLLASQTHRPMAPHRKSTPVCSGLRPMCAKPIWPWNVHNCVPRSMGILPSVVCNWASASLPVPP